MPKTVWRNGAPSTRNPPKDAPDWTTDAGMCTKINIVINPQCMHEGYGSPFYACECCVCVCYHATCYIPGLYIGNKAAGLAYKFAT